ncbi:sensor histidine kinase [Streptomyces fradiae]|uniref:sensor histidine kinase n=1 Tax=Streptomyces fradiae TaxID=1906 RepID=UPI002943DE45|nr:histidine kinase [Streptomyces fradiae]WOI59947.1 histidine kinase [Streptomyces fradiae]
MSARGGRGGGWPGWVRAGGRAEGRAGRDRDDGWPGRAGAGGWPRRAAAALLGRRARLRWTHLVLGGALLMPYWLLSTVVLSPFADGAGPFGGGSLWPQFGAYLLALPLAAVTGLVPLARPMSVAAARALCGVPAERFADAPAGSRAARARTAAWFTLHVGLGGLVAGASLALPPFALTTMALPFSRALRDAEPVRAWGLDHRWWQLLGVPAGALMLLALAAAAAAAGALLARRAPVLLGPTPADRLAAAERRAAELAVRNRLARELHDSVGHALSAVTLQAGAARRVASSPEPDLAFVREALTAIEETTRRTVGELDSVLGLLRQGEDDGELPGPGLEALDTLLAHCGLTVACTLEGRPVADVPPRVSREAYRIVQEGLSNALRHGGAAPVVLRLRAAEGELEVTMDSPLTGRAPVVRPGGGRGLRGIAERAALLGGHATAGPAEGGAAERGSADGACVDGARAGGASAGGGAVWRLSVRLPTAGGRR